MARHLARELLAQALLALAPPENVEQAEWFEKGRTITRKDRVRFALSGPGARRSKSEEELTIHLMDTCDALYGQLSGKYAHAHEEVRSKAALLESLVRVAEQILLILLLHRGAGT